MEGHGRRGREPAEHLAELDTGAVALAALGEESDHIIGESPLEGAADACLLYGREAQHSTGGGPAVASADGME